MRYKIWTTKTGERIPINKMSDSHLLNTMKMLIRNAVHEQVATERAYLFPAFGGPTGEAAQDAFDAEFDHVCERTTYDYLPVVWEDLEAEAIKRKLQVPEMPDQLAVSVLSLSRK